MYIKPEWFEKELFITDKAIPDLKKPFGKLLPELSEKDVVDLKGTIISVGDESTKLLLSLKAKPSVSVIDFKVARIKKFSSLSELGFSGSENVLNITNPPGTLSPELFKAVMQLLRNKIFEQTIVMIDGEDDLSVLPLVLASPLGNCIFYGQPDEGIVKVLIDENHKAKAREIVARFTTRGH